MSKITFSYNFLWVNFRRNFTFLLGLCLSIFIFNFNAAAVFAVQTPTLSVSVDNAEVNVNGNQVINSVNGTMELPLNLTINTTNKTGYTATLNTETNETALVNSGSANGAKIDSITGASSILNLPVNTWGFKISSETNYNPIPALSTPINIFQTTEKTNGNDVRGLNIGMKLSQNVESGSYDNKLIFSVVTNPYAGKAVMTKGRDFNSKLRRLETTTNKIERFKKSAVVPATSMNAVSIEDESSDYEIKLWLDPTDKTAYYYAEPEKVYLNADSSQMFDSQYDSQYGGQKIKNILELDLSNFDTSQVTNMGGMFYDISSLTSLNLSNFDTSQVTNMGSMFSGMRNLTVLNLSNFDTSRVTNMYSMFNGIRNLATLDLSNFDTSNVTDMRSMFASMTNITTLNLSNFNTSNVTDMGYMFFLFDYETKDRLEKIYVNNDFNTTNLEDFYAIFRNRKKLRGGNGSYLVDPSTADKTWLRVDRPGVQGYFTRKS